MKYTKPEVNILGEAAAVIQQTGTNFKTIGPLDGGVAPHNKTTPGYDLDE